MIGFDFGQVNAARMLAAAITRFEDSVLYSLDRGREKTLSLDRADSADRAELVELYRPLRAVRGATAGTERIQPEQYASRISDQRVPALLHGCSAVRRSSGRSIFAQADYRRRRHFLECAYA